LKRVLARALPETNSSDPVSQRVFFDHVLRSDESDAQKCGRVDLVMYRENSRANLEKITRL